MHVATKGDRDFSAFAIKHVLYPLWALKNQSPRLRYLAELERSQYWSRDALLDHQWSSFKRLFAHALETCPYYRKKFHEAGVTLADLLSPDDINKIPTITKEEIQEHRDEMVSSKVAKADLIADMTGGSTGSPMQFFYDEDRLDSRVAATIRHNRWAGWDIGDRAAILWGAPRDTRTSGKAKDRIRDWILDRKLILDASSLDEESMHRFSQELMRYRPTVLLAYANTLGLFASYLRAEGIIGISPRAVVCSAEVLTAENRQRIEETFKCPVFNRYGSREFAVIASECSRHEGMHINAENLLVEVQTDDKSGLDKRGEIVVTDLKNFSMPMIRYCTRDTGHLVNGLCSCGRGLPLLELSGGRVTDFLTATNGKKVSGIVISTYVITNIAGVRQIQFVQNEPGVVIINLAKGQGWSERSRENLMGKVREYLGSDMRIQIDYRDNIPLEISGKYRFSISTLPM